MKTADSIAASVLFGLGLTFMVGTGCESVGLRSMRIYMQQKNWEKALSQGQIAVAENPNDFEAWFAVAQVAAQVDSFDLMLHAMDRTLSLTKKHHQDIAQMREVKYNAVFNRAVEKYNAGDLPGAIEWLDLAARIDSTRANAYRVKGMVYQRTLEHSQAIEAYRRAFNADTSDVDLGRQYAVLLANTGQLEDGLAVMNRLYAANPGNKEIVLAYGLLLSSARRQDEALALVESALARDPDDTDFNARAGILCMEKAQADEDSTERVSDLAAAIPYFERAFVGDSSNADIAYNLAICYRQLRRLDDAIRPLEHILQLNPQDNQSRLQLATIYLQEEKLDTAAPHLEEIVNRIGEPTTAEDREILARTYRYLGIIYTVRGNEVGAEAQRLTEVNARRVCFDYAVRFRVTGTASRATVTYGLGGNVSQFGDVTLPWERVAYTDMRQTVSLTAQNTGTSGDIRAEISLGDQVLNEATSQGPYVVTQTTAMLPPAADKACVAREERIRILGEDSRRLFEQSREMDRLSRMYSE